MELLISGHNFAVQFSTTFRSNFDEPTTSWTTLRMSNIMHKGHKGLQRPTGLGPILEPSEHWQN